ncbi:segregation/condensation protein A [Vagococcus intermedius]|uniref:Segregation and condensation protein A n=1 Tax=Vagococcus intermedius TaxID=2991418 RepID=A0AAF0CWZ0_9ENTE|nr:segregation/condensation protein A [Vagococcus intermedius]WEG74257.1 segregation/condensation protein A [Vagococcus intermedius]WEG76339.1 segregation/condensation protein A [Vagococcus intermedius]
MDKLSVKLDVFEGPLDLLLHLIKTLEIDIYDIPIAEITTQYMDYIKMMKHLQLEVAGDYLVMAATLMSIKSKLLLPKVELLVDDSGQYEDEEQDPRAALVEQLLEYRKFKYAATVLHEKEEQRGQYFTKDPADLSEYTANLPPLEPHQVSTIDLFLAFHDVLERQKTYRTQETTISNDYETIEDKISYISKLVKYVDSGQGVPFSDLFTTYTKSEIVTTFMALLELIKSRQVIAEQENNYAPILLFKQSVKIEDNE